MVRTKSHMLTFSSEGYPSPDRLIQQAKFSGIFDSVQVFSNSHIQDLIRNRPVHFFLWKRRGFGFWIWKPRVILKKLESLPENDILVYLDQGFHIQASGAKRFNEYVKKLEETGSWIGVFSAGEHYRPEFFVRKSAVDNYYPDFYDGSFGEYVYAGILIIRNCSKAREAIRDWQKLCEGTPIWAPLPIRVFQHPLFIGQDGDNGYLPLVLNKLGGYFKFAPDEVNKLNNEGLQIHHVIPENDWANFYWGDYDLRPFLLKRDR